MASELPDPDVLFAMLRHAPGFIVFTDLELNILYLNRVAHGYKMEDALGANYLDFLSPEQARKTQAAFDIASSTGEQQRFEHFLDTPTGGRQWFSTWISLLSRDDGERAGLIHITTEITDRKRAEAQLKKTQEDLVQASHRAGMSEVATGVLHNVGNVLNSVNVSTATLIEQLGSSRLNLLERAVGLLEEHQGDLPGFLTSDERGQKLAPFLRQVNDELVSERDRLRVEVDRLTEHVNLVRATIDAQQSLAKLGDVVERTDPNALLTRALAMFSIDIDTKAVNVSIDTDGPQAILLDKQSTLQILANLIRNAIEAVEQVAPPRQLKIQTRVDDEWIRFDVSDNGCGIAADHIDKIFRHGFTTKQSGHGFGLHASAISAQAMRGSLTAASDGEGKGARFSLRLPRLVANP